jgi:hypothetical protein
LHPSLAALAGRQLLIISIGIIYDSDMSHLFDTTQVKDDLMQGLADQIGAAPDDHLAAVSPSASDAWTDHFINPTTGERRAIENLAVPADTHIVSVDGRALSGREDGKKGAP